MKSVSATGDGDQADLDLELLSETALAVAQSTIQNAINDSCITRAEFARRMGRSRSYITRILSGDHNLTVKTMARALGACGRQLHFEATDRQYTWAPHAMNQTADSGERGGAHPMVNDSIALAA